VAATKIADVIVPEIFNPYVQRRTMELSALFESGIVQDTPEVAITRGGTTVAMPFWDDLGGSEEILSDTTPLSVDKITSGTDAAVVNFRGKAWGANDLAKALSGSDPMAAIGDKVARWWGRRYQALLVSALKGVFASASMDTNKLDISGATGTGSVMSGTTLVDAIYLLGDAADQLTAFAIHSAVMAELVKAQLIQYLPDADGRPTLPTFMQKRVIVDDGMPAANGVYTTYLFGPGAVGFAEGADLMQTETDRDSLQGDDILINRRSFVLHPRGIKWLGAAVAGVSPTNAEFENPLNWNRVYGPKQIRIVQFTHRIAPVAGP
jgi:hypothetical protein